MIIKKIRLQNYKSIVDSSYLDFHKNITVLAGKNNAGKTAFIEGLYRFFQGALNLPTISGGNDSKGITQTESNKSFLEMELHLEPDEQSQLFINFHKSFWDENIVIKLCAFNGITFFLELSKVLTDGTLDTIYIWDYPNSTYKVKTLKDGNITYSQKNLDFVSKFFNKIKTSILFINGNRYITTPNQPINHNIDLDNYASNLHTVMHSLHNNHEEIYNEIKSTFLSIFSDVNQLRTSINNNHTNIQLVFDNLPNPIPLHECGTGFTHVLAMLCAIYSTEQRLILLDEPHSFLHPSAEKAIYDLASNNNNKEHQFIFTTHSPILINYPIPKTLYLVSKISGQSQFTLLNNLQNVFEEIGITNSDFAMSERVLFVEGQTEKAILPLILTHNGMKQFGYNYKIINIEGTGKEFSKKSAMNRNAEIHKKIFNSITYSPIPYCFIIDRDERSEEKIQELKNAYKDKIIVLDRREIENYFLVPKAIVSVLSGLGVEAEDVVLEKDINKLLTLTDDRDLFPRGAANPIIDVKGSVVLEKIFQKGKIYYDKIKHGKLIAKWLLDNQYGELSEIADLLKPFIQG